MTKSDIIFKLAMRFQQFNVKDTELAVKSILDTMASHLAKGNRIEIRGFGSFALNHHHARMGRNPKTGERVEIPAKSVPHFKAGKELRDRVDDRT